MSVLQQQHQLALRRHNIYMSGSSEERLLAEELGYRRRWQSHTTTTTTLAVAEKTRDEQARMNAHAIDPDQARAT